MPIYKIDGRKNGLQKYRVEVNITAANGKYKKIVRTAYGLQEAKQKEKEISAAQAAGSGSMTVQELYEKYISQLEVRETTKAKSISILKNHVLPTQKDIRLNKLNKSTLLAWKTETQQKGSLSIRMLQNIYKTYAAMLNFAVKMEYIPKNHLTEVGNFKDVYFSPAPEKLRYYTAEQYLKYNAAMLSCNDTLQDCCFYVFFSLAFYTGMRKGEINALKWSDIEGNIIHVRRSVSQKVKGKSIVETPPKTKTSYRDLQAPEPLAAILAAHKERLEKLDGFSSDWRVCGGPECLSDTSIENHNIKYSKLAGLPHITIHEFRHTHASILCNAGINIQEVARRLGHSNVQVTWQTYSHLYPREEERAVAIFDNIK